MRNLTEEPQKTDELVVPTADSVNFVQNAEVKEPTKTVQTTTETPIKPIVKMWESQPPAIVALHPSVAQTITDLDSEIQVFQKGIESNTYARQRAMKGVLKYYNIKTPHNINEVSFVKMEDGTFQLSVPQPDKFVEK